jgi:hypothetical protein
MRLLHLTLRYVHLVTSSTNASSDHDSWDDDLIKLFCIHIHFRLPKLLPRRVAFSAEIHSENSFHQPLRAALQSVRLHHDVYQIADVCEIKKLLPQSSVAVDVRASRNVDHTDRALDMDVWAS